ncbi:MAG: hypothetical protein ABIQ74_10715 [Chitinophagales bacterium]
MKCFKVILILLVINAGKLLAQGQSPEQLFGQNRVQYKDFTWSFYETDRFAVYFYLGGQDLGKFTIVDAAKELDDLEEKLEYRMNDRIEILVYNNLDDLKQSNIGYGVEINNTGGLTKIIGDKMFIYFNGSHVHLREQIREGISGIFLQNMLFGGSIGEAVQNAVLLKMPAWFKDGLTAYMSNNWSTANDNELRDGILSGKYRKLNKLTGEDARFAGQAVWHYIALKYGAPAIPNLLYLIRINRSMESGFNFVFGKSVKKFLADFNSYYQKQFSEDEKLRQFPDDRDLVKIRQHSPQVINELRINTDATAIAFVKNNLGKYKVCYRDLENGKNKTLLKRSFKNITQPIDYAQPQLAFSPSGKELTVTYMKKNKARLITYNIGDHSKEKRNILSFQKIFSINYTDANTLVLSAENKGQSDIYLFNIRSSKLEQITNDYYDDLNPQYIRLPARQGILFISNRISDTLRTLSTDTTRPIGNYNLFFYNLKKKTKTVLPVTHTAFANESFPSGFSRDYFSFLTDDNGIANTNTGYIDSVFDHFDHYYFFSDSTVVNPVYNMDSLVAVNQLLPDSTLKVPVYRDTAITYPLTNYKRSVLEQDAALRAGKMAQLILHNGKYEIYITSLKKDSNHAAASPPALTDYAKTVFTKLESSSTIQVESQKNNLQPATLSGDSSRADTAHTESYFFQSDFSFNPASKQAQDTTILKVKKTPPFRFSRILPYAVKFSTAYVVTQLDNSLIVTRYQPFGSFGGQFENPDLNVFFNLSITDLMEDYRITGGFRLPTAFNGTEYFMTFENLKTRLDKKFTAYRKSTTLSYDFTGANPSWYLPVNAKVRTYVADATIRYPFDFTRSIRASLAYRNDLTNFLATDSFSLGLAQQSNHWISSRLEYVFDNTMKIQTNIYDGLRYKIYFDVQRQVDQQKTFVFAAGIDVRYYLKIHRNFIWATRFNAAKSWGDQKIIYFLGGMENTFIPNPNQTFITETPVNFSENYAFQTIATNLRGFSQNIRNGNTFALINSELRFPVFSYLLNTPIRSELIKNFQLVAFFDIGSAWEGFSPYDKDNPFNSLTYNQGPVTVFVNYFREPTVYGYGGGARTTLLGYFVRVDYGQGVDSGAKQKGLWYFSLGMDF